MAEIILFQYKKDIPELDNFKTFFNEEHYAFYTLSDNQELSEIIFNRLKKLFDEISKKKIIIIDDIDIQWNKWDRIMKSFMLSMIQQKELSLKSFSVSIINRNNNKIDFFFNVWGCVPLPNKEKIIKDAKEKIQTL